MCLDIVKICYFSSTLPLYFFRYTQFLEYFLESAEQNYFVGFRVHYYLFTDQPEHVPEVKLGKDHQLTVMEVPSSNRWQEISLRRMERLEKLIESRLINEADYVFSLDVDSKFYGRWGAESLGRLMVPYIHGAVIGGLVKDVYQLAKTCREQMDIDAAKSIEAAWQEESHLNKYFLYNKPIKNIHRPLLDNIKDHISLREDLFICVQHEHKLKILQFPHKAFGTIQCIIIHCCICNDVLKCLQEAIIIVCHSAHYP
ncbi:Histo-blood group ABO system transferase [Labeo rohita]|uniref:Histo-blood group ABO system transferase n=1 Tax=Labeo rohita TaxID=84645 RepID=A0ABQ8LAS0_LABRO|nr:Histo-blood group ABO system transferase [Labeo rohita]